VSLSVFLCMLCVHSFTVCVFLMCVSFSVCVCVCLSLSVCITNSQCVCVCFSAHTTHSCSELSLLLLDIQLTLFFLRLLEVTTQTDANVVLCLPKYWAVERLLLHLACFEFLVLLFQSLLNSKCGDCYCWDKHKGICITELAVSTPKEILYNFLISKGIALISFWWCFPADILELAQKQFIPSWRDTDNSLLHTFELL